MSKPNKIESVKEPAPLLKAFSIERKNGNWIMVTIHYRDGKIEKIVESEPDLKMVAIERFKIQAFQYWSTLG